MIRLLAFLLGLLLAAEAAAAPAAGSRCDGTVGTTAANVAFPTAGQSGPPRPNTYLWLQNTSNNMLCYSIVTTATISSGACTGNSSQMPPGAGFVWDSWIPQQVSIIAAAAATSYACHYQ